MLTDYKNEPVFVDTSLLIYGYVGSEGKKGVIAKDLIKKVFDGAIKGCISNQILTELSSALLRKYKVPAEEVKIIANSLVLSNNWQIVNYNAQTVIRALMHLGSIGNRSLFDALIAETMKENFIYSILTENEKDFSRIPGINVINPFRRLD